MTNNNKVYRILVKDAVGSSETDIKIRFNTLCQQFGRGLRKAEGKTHVNILDFVGNSRAEFNYTDRMRVMLGRTSMSVVEEMERDCPHLPLAQLLRFILVFLANQRFVFLICFTVFYKF